LGFYRQRVDIIVVIFADVCVHKVLHVVWETNPENTVIRYLVIKLVAECTALPFIGRI
jgi:hypothetical protein